MLRASLLVLAASSALLAAPAAGEVGNGVSVVAGAAGIPGSSQRVFVAAHLTPTGAAGGHFSVTGDGSYNDMEVRCIRSLGDRTIVGGVIVDSWNPIVIGRTSLVAIRDGGPGRTDLMQIAFSISGLDSCPDGASSIELNPVAIGNFVVR